jgi:hypothetical protein
MVRSGQRGAEMAYYRNRCRELALGCNERFDLFLVIDPDVRGVSHEGVLHSFSYWGEFDAMFSNGLFHRMSHGQCRALEYDAWAWRQGTWAPRSSGDVNNRRIRRGGPLIPVLSAFGGLGLYTAQAFCSAEYSGGDCEHVPFHRAMHEHGYVRRFVNPSQIVLYNDLPESQPPRASGP